MLAKPTRLCRISRKYLAVRRRRTLPPHRLVHHAQPRPCADRNFSKLARAHRHPRLEILHRQSHQPPLRQQWQALARRLLRPLHPRRCPPSRHHRLHPQQPGQSWIDNNRRRLALFQRQQKAHEPTGHKGSLPQNHDNNLN